jgi:hypothetical protein
MHKRKDMADSERLEQTACNVLRVWAKDQRAPDEWIAALSDMWTAVHEYRASQGGGTARSTGKQRASVPVERRPPMCRPGGFND